MQLTFAYFNRLLIWEECYHGTLSSPGAPHIPTTGNHGINLQKSEGYQNAAQVGEQVGDRVRLLMEKMMMSNHVNMVGQGYGLSNIILALILCQIRQM